MALLRDIGAAIREHHVPDRERPAHAQNAVDFARLVRLLDRRHLLREEIVERVDIVVADLGIRRVGHGGIEPVPVLGDAPAHGPVEILERIIADAGFRIGRDVGRVDRAHRRAHLETAGKGLAPGTEWQATQSPARARYSPLLSGAAS